MDLVEILRVLRKRGWIVVPMTLLTFGLATAAFFYLPTTYSSHSTVSLLNAPIVTPTVGTAGQDNPFLMFDSSLTATADFLSRSLTAEASKAELKTMGVTEDYTAAFADNAQGPFVTLTVTGNDRNHVLASTKTITAYAGTKLRLIQAANGVKEADMIRMTQIIPPQEPEAQLKSKLKVVLGVAGGGLALTLLLVFLDEGIRRSRRREPLLVAQWRSLEAAPASPVVMHTPRPPFVSRPAGSDADETITFSSPMAAESRARAVSRVSEPRPQAPDETVTMPRLGASPVDPVGFRVPPDSEDMYLIGPSGPIPLNGQADHSPYGS